MNEQWKKIKDYPYKISNYGRVRFLKSKLFLNPKITKFGYCRISLYKNNIRSRKFIHVLVLEYFGPPKPSSFYEVNHKDGIKIHNWLWNLEWMTSSENSKHCFEIGTKSHKGEKHPGAKLNNRKVKLIRSLYKTGKYKQKELGSMFRVTQTHISKIVNNKNWRF